MAVSRASGEVVSVYPTQVISTFNVATGEEVQTARVIVISTSSGKDVYDAYHEASVFEPAVVDISNLAPGPYTVKVSYGSVSGTKSIEKL